MPDLLEFLANSVRRNVLMQVGLGRDSEAELLGLATDDSDRLALELTQLIEWKLLRPTAGAEKRYEFDDAVKAVVESDRIEIRIDLESLGQVAFSVPICGARRR